MVSWETIAEAMRRTNSPDGNTMSTAQARAGRRAGKRDQQRFLAPGC
jgi:hypothetical protein